MKAFIFSIMWRVTSSRDDEHKMYTVMMAFANVFLFELGTVYFYYYFFFESNDEILGSIIACSIMTAVCAGTHYFRYRMNERWWIRDGMKIYNDFKTYVPKDEWKKISWEKMFLYDVGGTDNFKDFDYEKARERSKNAPPPKTKSEEDKGRDDALKESMYNRAIETLKKKKQELDLELITQEEYDDTKKAMQKYIDKDW